MAISSRDQYMSPEEKASNIIKRVWPFVVGAVVALILLFGSCYTVSSQQRAVITRLGAVTSVTDPGPHLKLPFVDTVHKIPVITESVQWINEGDGHQRGSDQRMESYSKDQQPARIGVKITYHMKPDKVSLVTVFTQYGDAEGYRERVLVPRAFEAVKVIFGTYDAVRAIQERGALIKDIDMLYRKMVETDGSPVVIEGVQILDISFSQAYENAVEQRMQAQVEVQKQGQILEQERKKAEIVEVQARAAANARLAEAEAIAKAISLKGEAEATAIRAKGRALAENPGLPDLIRAERWNGQGPTSVVPGSAIPLVNVR